MKKKFIIQYRSLIIIGLILLCLNACCPEEFVYNTDTFFGTWDIVQIDSARWSGQRRYGFEHTPFDHDSARITFNSDSSGYFNWEIPYVAEGPLEFEWHLDKKYGDFEFYFEGIDYPHIGVYKSLRGDTAEIYYSNYQLGSITGGEFYFYFKMIKTNL